MATGQRDSRRSALVVGTKLLPAPLAALALARIGGLPWWPAVLLVALVTSAVLALFLAGAERRPFGLANGVTLLRLDLAACLLAAAWAGPATAPGLAWPVFAVAALALVLDGIDGWLARRRHEASGFGARFDMLSDAAFTIVLTLLARRFAGLGPWVLAIGLLWPAFVVAGQVWPALGAPLPPSRRRRAACGTALLLLTLALAPPLASAAFRLAASSLALLLLSFAIDIRHLLGGGRRA